MDKALQRLLETEQQAEKIAHDAEVERETLINEALNEARIQETRFLSRVPDLHEGFIQKAQARAQQKINELKKRYEERMMDLREHAQTHDDEALESAMRLILDPDEQ